MPGGGMPRRPGRLASLWLAGCLTVVVVCAPCGARAAAATRAQEEALKRLLLSYEKAIETKDLSLFRSVKPNLSGAEEDKLRASFSNIKDWRVNISISSVVIDGSQATVHASRNDTVNGKPVSLHQTFRLTKGSGGWTIREIGQ